MKFKIFTLILFFPFFTTTVQAAKIDVYRDILSSDSFTLKYTLNKPAIRQTNKEATLMNLFGLMFNVFVGTDGTDQSYSLMNFKGIVIRDSDNRYTKGGVIYSHTTDSYYVLHKNGETIRFLSYDLFKGGKRYDLIEPTEINTPNGAKYQEVMSPREELQEEYFYGTSYFTKAIIPIAPPEKVIATPYTPKYKFIGSGTLGNGLTYEDFFGSQNGFNCAVRYYFQDDKLVKIAVFDYVTNNSVVQSYERFVIDIDEFSSTPDRSYFNLPEEIQKKLDKRNKGAKK